MPERMTDDQLIQLVQEKLPEELTPEEIALLRKRLQNSPELQQTLVAQMHLEGYLAAALGEFSVSIDDIVRKSREAGKKPRTPWVILGLSSAALLVAIGLFFGLRGQGEKNPDKANPAIADKGNPSNPSTVAPARANGESDSSAASKLENESTKPAGPEKREPWVAVREAEEFDRGSLQVDSSNFGDGIGVVHSGDQLSGFVEYDFDVPVAGLFQLELRYASDESRPLRLSVNGNPVRADAAGQDTDDWWPEGQQSFVEARVELPAGKATVQLQTNGLFPHIDKLALAEVDTRKSSMAVATKDPQGLPILALRTAAPTVNIAAAAGGVKAPWEAGLDPSKPAVPWSRSLFASFPFADTRYEFPANELKQWLDPIGKHPLKIGEDAVGMRQFAVWDGIGRLKAPWPREAVLRLGLYDFERLRLNFWTGDEGISLQWFPRQNLWAAFRSTRKGDEPVPFETTLLTTDDGRHARTELGVFELRHQAGTLVMTRGDLRLMTVPMPRPPKEVVFDGRARVSGIAMYRGEPAPATPPNPRKALVETNDLSELKWVSQLSSPADMERAPDGTIELRSPAVSKDRPPQLLRCATPLERSGLYEVIVKVAGAVPGTGVYLGDMQGHPIHHVGFFQDDNSKRTTFGYGWSTYGYEQPPEFRLRSGHDPAAEPVPWAGREQWLRLVLGSGGLKIWSSGDGVNWGRATYEPIRSARGTFASVGLYAVTGEQPRQIRLQKLEVRELTGLAALADVPMRTSIPRINSLETMDYPLWLTSMLRARPRDAALPEWRRAYAVTTLFQNPKSDLANVLLRSLLTEALSLPISGAAKIQALEDAALVSDLWPGAYSLAFTDFYPRLGEQLSKQGEADAFNRASYAFAASSIQTEMKFNPLPVPLIRAAVLSQIHGHRWIEARSFAARTKFWIRSAHPDHRGQGNDPQKLNLVDWSDAVAAHWQGGKPVGEPPALQPAWRHPLVSQLSREGYNVLSELESALEGRSYEDACQLITATGTSGVLGLLPDGRDPYLQVSMPRAIVLAMRDHPDLQTTMREQYGKLGLLRVRQAVQDGQLETIQAAAIQYYGTEAASEANRWLGDRAVAAGRFTRGVDYYREALQTATATGTNDLNSRIRLASALAGEDVGEPVTGAIDLGGATLSAQSFEGLVKELQSTRVALASARREPAEASGSDAPRVPPVGPLEIASRGKLSGDLGQGGGGPADIDWAGRQLAVSVDGPIVYVSNRFHVGAWDTGAKNWKWTTGLGGEQGYAAHWLSQPMKPVVAGERIFVRRLTKNGPELACLDKATGKVLWNKRPDWQVASDPIWTRDKLFAVIATMPEGGTLQFDMATFHPETGEVLTQEPLFRAKNVWGGQPVSGIASGSGRLICSIGGSLVCCDLQGRPEWQRRSLWFPAAIDPMAHQQIASAPVVAGGRIYHAQPGSHEVHCIEMLTGRRIWSREIPELRRVIGLAGEVVVMQSASGVVGLHRDDGLPMWDYAASDLLEGAIAGSDGILVSRRVDWDAVQKMAALVWLDSATGIEKGRQPLLGFPDALPKLGPLVSAGGRWWAFLGRGNDAGREILEISPTAGAMPLALAEADWSPWLDQVPARLWTETSVALPGWSPLAVTPVSATWLTEFRGEKDSLVTRSDPGRPVTWVRRISPPDGNAAQLSFKVGHQPGQSWTLVISTGLDELKRFDIDDKSAPQGWFEATIDLSQFAGRTDWLVVQAFPAEPGKPAEAAWKRLDVVP